MDKERIDQFTTQVMRPFEENLPKAFTEFYQAVSRNDGFSAAINFTKTKG